MEALGRTMNMCNVGGCMKITGNRYSIFTHSRALHISRLSFRLVRNLSEGLPTSILRSSATAEDGSGNDRENDYRQNKLLGHHAMSLSGYLVTHHRGIGRLTVKDFEEGGDVGEVLAERGGLSYGNL